MQQLAAPSCSLRIIEVSQSGRDEEKMMPRIQFSYDGGDGPEDSVPRRPNSSLVRDAFCNPHTNCSPVCCCCGLLPISIAVKGVVWIAIVSYTYKLSDDPNLTK